MHFAVTYICPYCLTEQTVNLDKTERYTEHFVIYCDNEQGGCDMPLVLSIQLKPDVQVYRMELSDGSAIKAY